MSLWSNTDTQASKPKYLGLGQIQAINFTAGSGYTNGTSSITIGAPAAGGVQAVATVTIAGGAITGITISNPGAGYTSVPTTTFSAGGGTGGVLTAVIQQAPRTNAIIPNLNSSIVFVDQTEAQNPSNIAKGLVTPGWNSYMEYVDNSGATRYKACCLIAMTVAQGTSGDNTDDAIVGDATFSILTQPAAASVTAPAATSFTVAATGATAYQWQLRAAAGGQYSNITNGGVYTNATTATLNISNSTGLNGNRYRCIVANTTAGASATSNGALLTVA